MRPLIRWTFGKVCRPGQEVFQMAVKRFRSLYPEFDCIICYNNLRFEDQLPWLRRRNVQLFAQKEEHLDYPLVSADDERGWKGAMPGWGWKLCPPRLRPNAHELWVDNDLLIRERMPIIDRWLKTPDTFLISKGYRYLPEYYGNFSHLVPKNKSYCAGLFGLPPNFNFGKEIKKLCNEVLEGRPLGYYDEQGLVAAIISSRLHLVAEVETIKRVPKRPFSKSLHFITTNRYNTHEDWGRFKLSVLLG